jgi:outer membrane protein OmpA-like peptidoglycan-associated protein
MLNFTGMKTLFTVIILLFSLSAISQVAETFMIHFDFDKYNINTVAKKTLDSFLQSKPVSSIQKIQLYGHCDAIGNHVYNDRLSINRVNAIKEFLSRNNIPENVFDTLTGFGKRVPLNSNSGEYERLLNRRVEVIIQRKEKLERYPEEIKKDIPAKPEQTLTEKINDSTTKPGTNIILKNMNFYGGRHILLPQSVPTLTELLNVLKENPTLEIEIQGHICCTPGPEDGLDIDTNTPYLSVNRARAIYEHLLSEGIEKQRLSYRGFGHRRPLVYPEHTEERRTTNRRVEIKIIKK